MEQEYMPINNNKHIAKNITELIGGTPMIKILKMSGPNDAVIYAKLEWYNIGGSVKDRMALYIIEDAERKGKLNEGKTIIEATSGNTGKLKEPDVISC